MRKALWLECDTGVNLRNMIAALLNLGADRQRLDNALKSLRIDKSDYRVFRTEHSGVKCCAFSLLAQAADDSRCKSLGEITELIDNADISAKAERLALKILKIAAGSTIACQGGGDMKNEKIFSARDAACVTALTACLDSLGVEDVIVTGVGEGRGPLHNGDSALPVPSHTVLEILKDYQIKVSLLPVRRELVTVLGAAAIAALRTAEQLPSAFKITASGCGMEVGENLGGSYLRAMLIETSECEPNDFINERIFKLETDLDDCTGEALGYTLERLMAAGALDVHFIPVYMKKNRPGWQLQVICREETVSSLEEIIFAETTTIGIRRVMMQRTALPRKHDTINTVYGPVAIKICGTCGKSRSYVEFASAAAVAREKCVPLAAVYEAAIASLANDSH